MKEYNIINVISLEHREDRVERFHQQALEQKCGYRIWPGIIINHNNKKAINLAHKAIVQYAKDNNIEAITIAEDDCRFMAPGAWKYYLENFPQQYDIFFSMYYVADSIEGNRITGKFSGMTMYTVHNSFYDTFLSLPDDCHIDREMLGSVAHKYKFIFCDMVIAEQDGCGKSDNTNTTPSSYRPFLKGRKIFGGLIID